MMMNGAFQDRASATRTGCRCIPSAAAKKAAGCAVAVALLFLPVTARAQAEPPPPPAMIAPTPPPATSIAADLDAATPVVSLPPLEISTEREHASDTATAEGIETFGTEDIADTGAFSLDEFLDTLPPSRDDGEQLVLIDGEPTYLDPSSIPLEMIEGIDVSRDGSMPALGAYASGRVLNIRLKKNYIGATAGTKLSGSLDGGGNRQSYTLSGGATHGKLRLTFSLKRDVTDRLAASERPFSAQQDHTALGGRDLRLAFGSPATVQATSGALAGLTDADGNPVSVALVPEGQDGTSLTASDFIPGDDGRRRFNTAEYLSLVSPSTRDGANLSLRYRLGERMNVSLTGSFSKRLSEKIGPPPVTEFSDEAIVPAALNPFGQDVEVGLVHVGFGPTREETRSISQQLGLRFGGRVGESWDWNTGVGFRRSDSRQLATDLDEDAFAASLVAADPAQRFNPFGDPALQAINAQLYPAMTMHRERNDISDTWDMNFSTNGNLFTAWGGPVRTAVRASYDTRDRLRVTTRSTETTPDESRQKRDSHSESVNFTIPLVAQSDARPWLRRLETQLSLRNSGQSDGGGSRDYGAGLVWAPNEALSFRLRFRTHREAPGSTEIAEEESLASETLLDPRRPLAPATGVRVLTRETVLAATETSDRLTLGATLEPPTLTGLRFSVDYSSRTRRNIVQDDFDPQEIITNEAVFPGRVIRADPTPEDIALGLPGAITMVDVTPGNAGATRRSDASFSVEYRTNSEKWGRFRFTTFAERSLEARYEIQPGVAYVSEGESRRDPPDWSLRGMVSWSREGWSLSSHIRYTGTVEAKSAEDVGIPAYTTMDLNAGYRFRAPLWGKFGRGLRLSVSMGNVFNTPPTWADTLLGYRGGSALGRTWSLSARVPL